MSETSVNEDRPEGAVQTVKGGTGEMFDAIAGRYDLLNRLMSLGQDQYWRRKAVRSLEVGGGDRVLDVATGTGDLAIMIARRHQGVDVKGIDPSANMIGVGNEKIAEIGLSERVALDIGDGLALPFEEDTFDGAVVAFGIRNFPDRLKGLEEMARVTKPGRKVVVLELSEPQKGVLSVFAKAYVHHVVPVLGSVLSGKDEYRYLQASIEAFPPPETFVGLMEQAGLKDAYAKPLSFGAVHLFVGTVA
ncbi:MAG: bifunctional demethylmenaquinone methyltransferase/2-methoxy-6-polyprenyl-1,4-benzoquinol methylase UbiE [Myxococcota bacterium]